jgi:hypothetical protein
VINKGHIMMSGSRGAHVDLLLRGYGPLVAFLIFFGLMAVLVPTVAPSSSESAAQAGEESGTAEDGRGGDGAAAGSIGGEEAGAEVNGGDAGTHGGDTGTHGGDTGTHGGDAGTNGADGEATATAGDITPCEDRELQIPGDPYSPPCTVFDGDNPGATARGVTADEIVLSVRIPDEPGFQEMLADVAGADIVDTSEDIERTVTGLADYLNKRFEFYGRQIIPVFYEGQGSPTEELLGGGHEGAQADALLASQEIEAFAELNAQTEPFAAALAEQSVVNFGAPFVSREWLRDRRPYSWSTATDCSIVAESIAHWANVRVAAQPEAAYARGDLQGQPRQIGLVTPENPVYQQCLDAGMKIFEAEAPEEVEIVTNLSYALNIETISNQAANLVAQLQDEGVTSVVCNCDPVLPVFLTARAAEQDYWPEWVISGVGFTDQDIVGQLFDQEQWARAMGISYVGETLPQQATLGYHAYKQVRDDEPAFVVDLIYYTMYMLALGIQGAGPDLTAETFAQGMYDYPGGSGPAGTWRFGPDNHTPTEDFREVYWDPDAISPFNNEQGAYIDPAPGERHRLGQLPPGPPRVPW